MYQLLFSFQVLILSRCLSGPFTRIVHWTDELRETSIGRMSPLPVGRHVERFARFLLIEHVILSFALNPTTLIRLMMDLISVKSFITFKG